MAVADTPPHRILQIRASLNLGIYWGWMSLAFFSTALMGDGGIERIETANLTALALSTAVVVVIALLPKSAADIVERSLPLRAATIAAGSLGTFLVLNADAAGLLSALGSCLMGFSEGLLLYLFVAYAVRICQSSEEMVVLFSWALLIAAALYLIAIFTGHLAGFLCALMPLFAFGSFLRAEGEKSPHANKDGARATLLKRSDASTSPAYDVRRLPWKLLLGLAVFGIAFGLMRVSASTEPVAVFQTSYLYHTLARAGTAAVALMMVKVLHKAYWSLSTLQLLAFTLGVCGYWLPLESTAALTVAATTVGYTCLELMLWAVLFELFLETRIALNALYGIVRGLVSIATLVATGYAMFVMSTMDPAVIHVVLLFFLLAMILVSTLLFGSRNVASLWGLERQAVSTGETGAEEIATLLTEQYGLTSRENEVMALLMKGRNEPFISEALFISPATTHSHVTHIYAKLGVHSRQELLDTVEQLLEKEA